MDSEPRPQFFVFEYYLLARAFQGLHTVAAVEGAAEGDEVFTVNSSWEPREQLAAACGRWIRDRIGAAGDRRELGECPKQRLQLRSRVWLCFVDREGCDLSPVVVALRAGPVDELGGDRGRRAARGLTIGFPSQRETRVCVAAAGSRWPSEVLRRVRCRWMEERTATARSRPRVRRKS